MTQISSYFAKVSIDVDKASIKRVDALLSQIESRFTKFQKRIAQLTKPISVDVKFDQAKFKSQFNNLKIPAIKIDQFTVNSSSLNRAVQSATSAIAPITLRTRVLPPSLHRLQQGFQERTQRRTSGLSTAFGVGSGGGFGAGLLMRAGPVGAVVAGSAALGMFGSSQASKLNELNQQIVQAQSSLANTLASFGQADKTKEWNSWYRENTTRLGVNWLQGMPELSKTIANGLSLGLSTPELQNQITAQMEFGRANNMSQDQMRRFQLAWNQILATGRLQGDEMNQMADSGAAGINGLFATAWANITKSGKTDAAAMKQLLSDRQKGLVLSDKILPEVARLMRLRAAPALDAMTKTSSAEQARYQNTRADFASIASVSGLEAGFARIYKTLEQSLQRLMPLAESFGRSWDRFSVVFESSITKISEAFAIFNGYTSSFNKLSLSDGTISALQSLGDTFNKLGENVTLLKERLSTIASSPLFQTVANVFGGIASYILNAFNSLANAINQALKGNFIQAVKELSGATPISLLPQVTSPAEQRNMDAKDSRNKEVKEFNTFNQLGGNIAPPSPLSLPWQSHTSPTIDVVVQSQREREKALASIKVLGQSNSLPDIVLNNKTEIPKFIAPVINFQKERQQRLQLPDVKIATPNVAPPNKAEQLDKLVEQKRQTNQSFNVSPNITVSATVNATDIDDMTNRVTEIFRYQFRAELSKELTGTLSSFGAP